MVRLDVKSRVTEFSKGTLDAMKGVFQRSDRIQKVEVVPGDHLHGKIQYRVKGLRMSYSRGEEIIDPNLESTNNIKAMLDRGLNKQLNRFFYFTNKANFFILFLTATLSYFLFVVIFALLLILTAINEPTCISTPFRIKQSFAETIALAFHLSWTTFTTVGYGNISPTVITGDNSSLCFATTGIASLESLFGILYSGFWSAILFGRLQKFQSKAPVYFSKHIIVRYNIDENSQSDDKDEDEDSGVIQEGYPCPSVIIRVINTMHDSPTGEIVDARMSIAATLNTTAFDEKKYHLRGDMMFDRAFQSKKNLQPIEQTKNIANKFRNMFHHGNKPPQDHLDLSNHNDLRALGKSSLMLEDRSNAAPSFISINLSFTPVSIPYFKRVWFLDHILDCNSPLLSKEMRRKLKLNNNRWPEEDYCDEKIEKHISFDQILVSMTGVSHVSGSNMYARTVYDRQDLLVGYECRSNMIRLDDNRLAVLPATYDEVDKQHLVNND